MVVELPGDPRELQRAFDHAERRVAVVVHDPVGQRAVVGADPHRAAERLAELHQRDEFLADLGDFLGVFVVGVFADGELLLVDVVAGVDADLLDPAGGLERGVGLEMDVGDQRDLAAGGADLAGDVFQVGGVDFRLCGDADDLAAGLRELEHLGNAGGGVAGVGGDHRLHADRVPAADADVSDHHFTGLPPVVGQQVGAVSQQRVVAHFAGDTR